uniref:Uncharacterized protein n=1 Tax=Vitis vinifera TaxID=29760 RepID=F6GXM1_VITVI
MPSSSPVGAFSRKVELETRNRSLRRPDFLGRNGGSMKEMVMLAVNWRWPPSFRSLNKYTTSYFTEIEIGVPRSAILQRLGFKFLL